MYLNGLETPVCYSELQTVRGAKYIDKFLDCKIKWVLTVQKIKVMSVYNICPIKSLDCLNLHLKYRQENLVHAELRLDP